MNNEKKWIEQALKDVEASILLYKNKLYSHSYFHFQQASEKGNKAFWLLDGQMKEKDLKSISHNQFKIPKKTLTKNIENTKSFEFLEGIYPELLQNPIYLKFKGNSFIEYKNNIKGYQITIDRFRNTQTMDFEISHLENELQTLNELMCYDNVSNDIFKEIKPVLKENEQWIKKYKKKCKNKEDLLFQIIDYYSSLSPKSFFTFINDYTILTQKLAYISFSLSACSFLTDKHNQTTRYPNAVNNIFPLDYYDKSLNIVRYQMKFLNHLKKGLNLLLYTYYPN